MVKRHERSSFGAAYAFPGGVLEPADQLVHKYCGGLTEADANRLLEVEGDGLDYFSAAIRELFEEAGVLLGKTALTAQELDDARAALNGEALSWDQFVVDNAITLPCDRLHYFSFWITPVGLQKRYSTRFFLTALPAGQSAVHCGGELTDSCWMPAADILAASRNKTIRVHHPTRMTLQRVAEWASTNELVQWADRCSQQGVICDQPAFAPEFLQ